jgi:hypothetical protein
MGTPMKDSSPVTLVFWAAALLLIAGCSSSSPAPGEQAATPKHEAAQPAVASPPGNAATDGSPRLGSPSAVSSSDDLPEPGQRPVAKPVAKEGPVGPIAMLRAVEKASAPAKPAPERLASAESPRLMPAEPSAKTGPPKVLSAVVAEEPIRPNPLREKTDSEPEQLVPVRPEPATPKPSAEPTVPERPSPPAKPEKPEPGTNITVRTDSPSKPAASGNNGGASVPRLPNENRPEFDPIKENGKVFVDWRQPPPKLVLAITGRQDGYIEPCGCAGLDRMKGGMSRRYSFFKELRGGKESSDPPWPGAPVDALALDVGGIAKGFGRQAELKFQIMVEGMRKMGYNGIGLGLADLQLPTEEVLAAVANEPSPFLSANVGLFEFNDATLGRTRVVAAGGKRVGLTAVLSKSFQAHLNNPSVKTVDPVKALAEVLPELRKKADFLVLLAYATTPEARQFARQFPFFDVVVSAGGPAEPPAQAEVLHDVRKGDTRIVEVGEKGMYAVVLGIFDDAKQPVRYQRVPLDARYPLSKVVRMLMVAYQGQLQTLGLEGLGIHPLPYPAAESNGRFVGTDECKKCHEESYRVWKKTPHSHAYDTLVNKADPPRNYDPECLSCHVVGWNPSKYFPYVSGYLNLQKTPKLINVGCEDCHGPGEKHVLAENSNNKLAQDKARRAVIITKAESADPASKKQNCFVCHDGDNSPDFDFKTYWPIVKHYEK